jgi:hypothetical protein
VIEIRDAQLVLRPYSSAAVARLAAAVAQESGLSQDRTAAVAEAATIISALRARGRGSMVFVTAFPTTLAPRLATTSVPKQPGLSSYVGQFATRRSCDKSRVGCYAELHITHCELDALPAL